MGKILVYCDNCAKPVLKWPRDLKRSKNLFCSNECHSQWTRKQGKKPYNFKGVYIQCENCGKVFHRSPANIRKHIFCSKLCCDNFRREKLICAECGKNFVRRKSRIKSQIIFCSKSCQLAWLSKHNPNPSKIVTRTCKNCNKPFKVIPSSTKLFCSNECVYIWQKHQRMGRKNPNWKAKLKLTCSVCGKKFETHPSKHKKRFCSRKCYLIWHKTEWKISDKNRVKMLKALLKRPTKPEKKLITIIKQNKFPFRYVGDGSLIVNGLNPDFINKDTKAIIEVFGNYWHNPEVCNWRSTETARKIIFGKAGYKTLIIWEHELGKPKCVVDKIEHFCCSLKGD